MAEFRVDADAILELTDGGFAGAEINVDLNAPIKVVEAFTKAKGLEGEWAVFVAHGFRSWNLADKTGPIPIEEADARLGLRLRRAIVGAWFRGLVQPPAPLPPPPSGPTT